MKAIIAVNERGYIGLDGGLPWGRCKDDLAHFKSLTMGGKLLCGPKTAETLPPLSGRELIIWDRDNWSDLYLEADWCIGGKATYQRFMPLFTEVHISVIADHTIGDTSEPDWFHLSPKCKVFHYQFKV